MSDIEPVPPAADPAQTAAIEKLAERAVAVSKRLATHGIPVDLKIARHQNGHMAVHFDVHVDFMIALGEMLAHNLEVQKQLSEAVEAVEE